MTDSGEYPLTPTQQRAWLNYMRVYHRLEYEMNHHLRTECGLSLYDYTVLSTLSRAPDRRLQVTSLATVIGWERSRLSHHLLRMTRRGLIERAASATDGRGTVVILSAEGENLLARAVPVHAEWVRRVFFADLDPDREDALADILATVHESLLREGTLPHPDI
ncbi:MarR family winged helix-turn-helix transcriptional regulator [Mycobacterium sp. 21AC1]|uniref:MarR family winged helix-turn-helix transcriptional regulator n=1 Tax=[Mycobacterium] appelbergii TaxID=2939269 RepID=UPI0029393D1E|nr:MarR family winged helix-turn-helix transcriptional regulator [Mycobacterium sp. 21AC1]MDV3123480.1 MarR family winged helix-turn-helix transcriptional regulator [Mycobacterium sp. 21AC1]